MSEWISVDERLPEECRNVLAYVPGWRGCVVAYVNHEWDAPWLFAGDPMRDPSAQPTHWMPLPPPPEQQ